MNTLDQLRQAFTQSLAQSIITTSLSFVPKVVGEAHLIDPSVITQAVEAMADKPFGSNILSLSVESLLSHVPNQDGPADQLYNAAMLADEQTIGVVQDVSYRLAQSLRTAFDLMTDCAAADASGIAEAIEQRISLESDDRLDPSRGVSVFNWGVLADDTVLFHVLSTCGDASPIALRSDASNAQQVVDAYFGTTSQHLWDTSYGEDAARMTAVVAQVGGTDTEQMFLNTYLSKPAKFEQFLFTNKAALTTGSGEELIGAVQALSDGYAAAMNFKRLANKTQGLDVGSSPIFDNLDKMLTCLSLSLGAVQAQRTKYNKTLVLSATNTQSWDQITVDLNADAYKTVQDQVAPQTVLSTVRYLTNQQKQPVSRQGISTTKIVSLSTEALAWSETQDSAATESQKLSDAVSLRRLAEQEITKWAMRVNKVDAANALSPAVKIQVEDASRRISVGNAAMLDTLTGFVVKQYNESAVTSLYDHLMTVVNNTSGQSDVHPQAINAQAAAHWLVDHLIDVQTT